MLLNFFDRLGELNPQLFRELKGRLKPRTIAIAVGVSLLVQFFLLNHFYGLLPTTLSPYSPFCTSDLNTGRCLMDSSEQFVVEWPRWWEGIFRWMNWVLILVPTLAGVYMLANDVDQEERRGTLNFIRLSPQSSRTILFGKLLGTPVLLYLAIAIALPLHLVSAWQSNVPAAFVLSFYLNLVAACYFLFSSALLWGFMSKLQTEVAGMQVTAGSAFLGTFLAAFLFLPNFIFWNVWTVWSPYSHYIMYASGVTGNLTWFGLPIGENLWFSHGLTLLLYGGASYIIWQAIDRRFHSPDATLLSKKQSYITVASTQVLLLGFLSQDWGYSSSETPDSLGLIIVMCSMNLLLFLVLIAVLAPHRQTLLDWSRYRHMNAHQNRYGEAGETRQRRVSSWQDLIWGDKSPVVVAIAVNLLIVAAFLLPWILLSPDAEARMQGLLGLIIFINLVALYTLIGQLTLLLKTPKRVIWAGLGVSSAMGLPLIIGLILFTQTPTTFSKLVLLFSPAFWATIAVESSMSTIFIALIGQWGALAFLNAKLNQQLKRFGESASKPLLTGR